MKISEKQFEEINKLLNKHESSKGLEFYPFCTNWYNEQIDQRFCLQYPDNTLAFCIVSVPSFFKEQFIPFIREREFSKLSDPLDQCLTNTLKSIKNSLTEYDIEIIHDFEVLPNRRPKLLVQTAGHVSGAAYYYQAKHVENPPWKNGKKIYGVSSHPVYGGWFSFRGAFIFKNVQVPYLKQKDPIDRFDNDQKIKILDRFNFHWEDWTYRDVLTPRARYDEYQKKYFLTKPADRFQLIDEILEQEK